MKHYLGTCTEGIYAISRKYSKHMLHCVSVTHAGVLTSCLIVFFFSKDIDVDNVRIFHFNPDLKIKFAICNNY
jgi:hypothetical protein